MKSREETPGFVVCTPFTYRVHAWVGWVGEIKHGLIAAARECERRLLANVDVLDTYTYVQKYT